MFQEILNCKQDTICIHLKLDGEPPAAVCFLSDTGHWRFASEQ
jgi:hypothetical protein